MMVTDFYLLRRCASPQLQKFESFIYFHAQSEYGSELGEDYHNIICKQYLIHTSQEYFRTTVLLYQYFHHLALCHFTQRAYQLLTIFFSETGSKLYYVGCNLAISDPPSRSICILVEIKNHFKIS